MSAGPPSNPEKASPITIPTARTSTTVLCFFIVKLLFHAPGGKQIPRDSAVRRMSSNVLMGARGEGRGGTLRLRSRRLAVSACPRDPSFSPRALKRFRRMAYTSFLGCRTEPGGSLLPPHILQRETGLGKRAPRLHKGGRRGERGSLRPPHGRSPPCLPGRATCLRCPCKASQAERSGECPLRRCCRTPSWLRPAASAKGLCRPASAILAFESPASAFLPSRPSLGLGPTERVLQ